MKGITEDEKVAINLQLKEEYRNIWFGNFDMGLDVAGEDFHSFKFNLIRTGSKLKHFFVGDVNNIGSSSGDNRQELTAGGIGAMFAVAEGEHLMEYTSASVFNLSIHPSRYDHNKQQLGSYNTIYSFSDNTNLTMNFTGQWNKQHYLNQGITHYYSGLDFTNTRSQDLFRKAFSGKINVRSDKISAIRCRHLLGIVGLCIIPKIDSPIA